MKDLLNGQPPAGALYRPGATLYSGWIFRTMAVPEFYSGKVLYPAIAVLIGLSTLFGLAILPRLGFAQNGMVGKPAPDFTLPVAANGDDGARMQLAELKGRPVVIDFWASWCGPCAMQAPILDRLARKYEGRGLVVLGVNIDDPPAVAKEYARRKGLSYPILIDPRDQAAAAYGVSRLPSLIVVDRQGNVSSFMTGLVDEPALDEVIAGAM